ncbi:NADH dehydrogenase subunit 5 (mitochondrion) [Ramazzottius varieornatus]|uniref:NADH-ubiquinone oxidoreductase chain 5 n=1 Tax=Ramazzottius varieornatus TaxID=947166 RepID=A0A1C9ZW45_RAMVA|nr:NADH dehydrogenase subunit 5 [Ramazzottius varieornatus]BAV58167.1 NADH dehydrogenase subunit 5 [Ramazzottius varieornatus]
MTLWLSGFFFVFFLIMTFFLFSMGVTVIEFQLFTSFFTSLSVSFVIDFYSILFASVVSFISAMIFFFSQFYMDGDTQQKGFSLLLSGFVISMFFLIFSPNLFFLLLGWDGLGLVSYLLVVYYMSVSSSVAGMLTFLMNRVGDIFFLFSLSLFSLFSLFSYFDNKALVFVQMGAFFLLITFITKSAQIPFSSWLPAAMAAPTPVSSLVHSSTLVTAGVFLLIRFSPLMLKFFYFLIVISVFTMLMAGTMANLEWDMKKIIAYSTLSQLSFMMLSYSTGLIIFCFFHLLTHALFKASLFMSGGLVIHSEDSSQDFRNMSPFSSGKKLFASSFVVCILSLCGFPFLSGFFSKDLILDTLLSSFVLIILFLIGVFMTILYSLRFSYYMLISLSSFRSSLSGVYENVKYLILPIWSLIIFSIVMGSFWSEFFFNFFFFFTYLLSIWKLFYLMLVAFLSLAYMFILKKIFFLKLYFFSFMWVLNQNMTARGVKLFTIMADKIFCFLDQSWWEFYGPQNIFFSFTSASVLVMSFVEWSLVYFFALFIFLLFFFI